MKQLKALVHIAPWWMLLILGILWLLAQVLFANCWGYLNATQPLPYWILGFLTATMMNFVLHSKKQRLVEEKVACQGQAERDNLRALLEIKDLSDKLKSAELELEKAKESVKVEAVAKPSPKKKTTRKTSSGGTRGRK